MAKVNSKKIWLFRVILFSIPVLILLLAELALRIGSYQKEYGQAIVPYKYHSDYLTSNRSVGQLYFGKSSYGAFGTQDTFLKNKPADRIRIFALGGSSTAGYPYMYSGTFPALLEQRLQALYPDHPVEVINLGMTAVNSYTVRDLARACLDYNPDLLIIYAGHNEFYGTLGSGSARSAIGTRRNLTLAYLNLRRIKLFQLISNLAGRIIKSDKQNTDTSGTLMATMAENQSIALDSKLYRKTGEIFRANVTDIIRWYQPEGVPVLLSTLVSNLKDQPPFVSLPGDSSAQDHYQAGRQAEQQGQFKLADYHYRQAKDRDGLRFRASEDLNKIIRSFNNETGVFICDTDNWFRSISPDGLIGNNLILEHLHPNLEGYFQIAKALSHTIVGMNLLRITHPDLPPPVTQPDDGFFRQRMPVTELDHQIANYRIQILTSGWPFNNSDRYIGTADLQPTTRIESLAKAVLTRDSNFEKAHVELAEYFRQNGNIERAIAEYRVLSTTFPANESPYQALGKLYIEAGDYTAAKPVLRHTIELINDSYSYKWLGAILVNESDSRSAIPYLKKAVQLNPVDYQASYNLSGAYFLNGDTTLALRQLDLLLGKNPRFPGAQQFYNDLTKARQKKK